MRNGNMTGLLANFLLLPITLLAIVPAASAVMKTLDPQLDPNVSPRSVFFGFPANEPAGFDILNFSVTSDSEWNITIPNVSRDLAVAGFEVFEGGTSLDGPVGKDGTLTALFTTGTYRVEVERGMTVDTSQFYRVRFTLVPVPEPTTGLLVAGGLMGLAFARGPGQNRRS